MKQDGKLSKCVYKNRFYSASYSLKTKSPRIFTIDEIKCEMGHDILVYNASLLINSQ